MPVKQGKVAELIKYGRTLEATTLEGESMAASNWDSKAHKVYTKPQTRQLKRASNVDCKVKPSWGRHFSNKFSAGSHTCNGCGGTRHNTREKQYPAWEKCYKRGRDNNFASVCHAENKMHFVKHGYFRQFDFIFYVLKLFLTSHNMLYFFV